MMAPGVVWQRAIVGLVLLLSGVLLFALGLVFGLVSMDVGRGVSMLGFGLPVGGLWALAVMVLKAKKE